MRCDCQPYNHPNSDCCDWKRWKLRFAGTVAVVWFQQGVYWEIELRGGGNPAMIIPVLEYSSAMIIQNIGLEFQWLGLWRLRYFCLLEFCLGATLWVRYRLNFSQRSVRLGAIGNELVIVQTSGDVGRTHPVVSSGINMWLGWDCKNLNMEM